MNNADTDKVFTGSIAQLYETHLVPLLFEPYAADLVNRLATRKMSRVLEIAAGTGVVTRALATALPEHTVIVATDLNEAMLDQARRVGTSRPVQWRQADAMQLPFADGQCTPHGYSDAATIERDLAEAGFTAPSLIATVAARSRATSARFPAMAYCQGSPLRSEIVARDASRLDQATDMAAEAIASRFGRGDVDGKIQAHVFVMEA